MSKVLIICDRPSWAFDNIAKALIKYNDRPDLDLSIFYLKGNEKALSNLCNSYDMFFPIHWSLAGDRRKTWVERIFRLIPPVSAELRLINSLVSLPKGRVITGIHAHHDWDQRLTTPERNVPPPQMLVDFLAGFPGVNIVSKRLFDLFVNAGLTNLHYTPNGVDTDVFSPIPFSQGEQKLRVGTSGTKKRDWKEGITEFIEPLGEVDFVDLRIATPEDDRYIPPARMPEFLNSLDVYVLASLSEGFPLKVLEACACGRPVVTTKVGGCEELITDGLNGFFVERRVEDFIDKLTYLHKNRIQLEQMGKTSRKIIEEKWSWKIRAKAWLDFIELHLECS